MSDIQKSERFSFGIPSSLDYCFQPYPVREAGTPTDQGRRSKVFNVDNYTSSGYFCRIEILCLDVKKAGHVDPLPVDIDGWNRQCFPCDQTAPGTSWAIMEANKPYRRFSPRRLIYILCATLPAESSQPVSLCGRDPPTDQTQQG